MILIRLREIRIYFYDSNWDHQLDSLTFNANRNVLADIIIEPVHDDPQQRI